MYMQVEEQFEILHITEDVRCWIQLHFDWPLAIDQDALPQNIIDALATIQDSDFEPLEGDVETC